MIASSHRSAATPRRLACRLAIVLVLSALWPGGLAGTSGRCSLPPFLRRRSCVAMSPRYVRVVPLRTLAPVSIRLSEPDARWLSLTPEDEIQRAALLGISFYNHCLRIGRAQSARQSGLVLRR